MNVRFTGTMIAFYAIVLAPFAMAQHDTAVTPTPKPAPMAEKDQTSRIIIRNRSGYPVNLFYINSTSHEKQLKEEYILDGNGVAVFGFAGHEYEIGKVTNSTEEKMRTAVFQVGETHNGKAISSTITVDENLELIVEDFVSRKSLYDMTSKAEFEALYPRRLRLNRDLSLFPRIESISSVRQMDSRRFDWQMDKFRNSPTVGLIENKLLAQTLMMNLGIPIADIYYGAFWSKSMGGWPKYDRDSFIDAMHRIPEVARDHHFVLKTTTAHGARGVILMNDDRWKSRDMNFEKLADEVEDMLEAVSDGMKYDHRGVMVQRSILPEHTEIDWYGADFEAFFSQEEVPVFELKTHIVFGRLCAARIQTVPIVFEAFVDITFCDDGGPSFYYASGVNGANRELWEITRSVIESHAEHLAQLAEQITNIYGLDLFRLDVFMDDSGMIVNEVTYPSYSHSEHDCANSRLLDAYKMATFDILDSESVLSSLLQRIDVSYDDFINETDYDSVDHLSDERYESKNYFNKADMADHHFSLYHTGVYHDDIERDTCVARASDGKRSDGKGPAHAQVLGANKYFLPKTWHASTLEESV